MCPDGRTFLKPNRDGLGVVESHQRGRTRFIPVQHYILVNSAIDDGRKVVVGECQWPWQKFFVSSLQNPVVLVTYPPLHFGRI